MQLGAKGGGGRKRFTTKCACRHPPPCFWITSAAPSTPSPRDPQLLQRRLRSPRVELLFHWSLCPSLTKAALAATRRLSKRRQLRQGWKVYSFSVPFVKVGSWRAVMVWKTPNVKLRGDVVVPLEWWVVHSNLTKEVKEPPLSEQFWN